MPILGLASRMRSKMRYDSGMQWYWVGIESLSEGLRMRLGLVFMVVGSLAGYCRQKKSPTEMIGL